jgi:PDZ domain
MVAFRSAKGRCGKVDSAKATYFRGAKVDRRRPELATYPHGCWLGPTMNRFRSTALAVLAAASWVAVGGLTGNAQQNTGNQNPGKPDQAAESRSNGPFRGGFLRRLRDDLRGAEEARAAKEKEKAAANRDNREPTPARRPNSGQQPNRADGQNGVDWPVPGAGRLPGTNAPGFHLSDSGVLPLPGSPQRAPEASADRLPVPPRQGFGLVLADRDEKLFVQTVEPDGNAAECGLRRGDQVLQLGGIDIHSIAEFDEITGIMKAGDQIDLVFSRDGEKSTAQLQFGSAPPLEEATEGPPLVAETDPDSPAPDFVPEPARQQLPILENGLAAPPLTGNGSSVLQQPQFAPGIGVEQLQQTVLQQQQIIRQLQQDVENLRRQLQASQRPQASTPPRTNQSSRRRD